MGILNKLKGDKVIWGVFFFLIIASFLSTYSASSYMANVMNKGTTFGYLIKHTVIVLFGIILVYFFHNKSYKFLSWLSVLGMPAVFLLMLYTLSRGTVIAGATASRWIVIPFIGVNFQTSTLASLVVMIYTARYFAIKRDEEIEFKESFLKLWIPVGIIMLTVLPPNFSTAALLFLSVSIISLIGGYPFKYWLRIAGMALAIFVVFVLTARMVSPHMRKKIDTWKKRLVEHKETKIDPKKLTQVDYAKMAISTGGVLGNGPGKSKQRNFLSQSSSDFIFAIIVEEYGLLGGGIIIFAYFWLLYRFFVVAKKAKTVFGSLLVLGVGIPLIIQAIVNMMVATNLIPVTGQTLPLLSRGGSSVVMTCIAIAIVLSVSASSESDTDDDFVPDEDNPLSVLYENIK